MPSWLRSLNGWFSTRRRLLRQNHLLQFRLQVLADALEENSRFETRAVAALRRWRTWLCTFDSNLVRMLGEIRPLMTARDEGASDTEVDLKVGEIALDYWHRARLLVQSLKVNIPELEDIIREWDEFYCLY